MKVVIRQQYQARKGNRLLPAFQVSEDVVYIF